MLPKIQSNTARPLPQSASQLYIVDDKLHKKALAILNSYAKTPYSITIGEQKRYVRQLDIHSQIAAVIHIELSDSKPLFAVITTLLENLSFEQLLRAFSESIHLTSLKTAKLLLNEIFSRVGLTQEQIKSRNNTLDRALATFQENGETEMQAFIQSKRKPARQNHSSTCSLM